MKKMTTALAVVLFTSVLFGAPARGDGIPPGYHLVFRDVLITNVDEHPDIVLVAYVVGPMIDTYEAAVVEQGVPLNKGYKFNSLRLFALQKSAFDNAGGLAGIDFKSLAATIEPAEIIDPGMYLVVDENPLQTEECFYRIQSTGAGVVTLALKSRVLKYNNGTTDRVEEF
ncbi:MAG: hypothetical protein J7M25_02655 [Deltaproteobacteria bacterium]|nr:hypothetical protein [Deltaproteobacteria bacterium]